MLNIAAEFGESMTVMETADIPENLSELTDWVFFQLGKTTSISLDLFGIGGVLSGPSGPSIAVALDGILDGAVGQRLKRAQARTILIIGPCKAMEQGNTGDTFRGNFSSPRGTTVEGFVDARRG